MERFLDDGHLTDAVLLALASGEPLDELTRLEAAEHLAYCDRCLQRYTDLLTGEVLLSPPPSCQRGLWSRIRLRALRLAASRQATAAAAVVLALTVLWGGRWQPVPDVPPAPAGPSAAQRLENWPQRWNDALDSALSGLRSALDTLGNPPDFTT